MSAIPAIDSLLSDWGATSVITVVALVVSMVTVQFSYLVRKRETFERMKRDKLAAEEINKLRLLGEEHHEMLERLRRQRAHLQLQQLDLIRSLLNSIATDGDSARKLDAAKEIIAMMEDSLKSMDRQLDKA